jgi:hypothetical protein
LVTRRSKPSRPPLQRQEAQAKFDSMMRSVTASKLTAAGSQEDFDKIASSVPAEYGLKPGEDYQAATKRFRSSMISPEQEATNAALTMRSQALLDRADRGILKPNATGQLDLVDPRTGEKITVDDATKPLKPSKGSSGGGGGTPAASLTPESAPPWMVSAARDYHVTHQLPPLGKDVASKKAILALHSQLYGDGGAAGSASDFKAGQRLAEPRHHPG